MLLSAIVAATAYAATANLAATPVSGRDYVEYFLKIADERSMFAEGEQWARVKNYARTAAGTTTDSLSAYPIVAQSIRSIGDQHGGLNPTEAQTAEYKRRYGKLWVEADYKRPASRFMERKQVSATDRRLSNGKSVRILSVPRVFQNEDEQAYASRLFMLASRPKPATCAFILDLRGNIGGDMWPMLAGLSPLLGQGAVGAASEKNAQPVKWQVAQGRAGELHSDGKYEENFAIKSPVQTSSRISRLPVALLIDDGVLSSGEVVTVAFRGRPLTKSFGRHTFGLSTNNTAFDMPDGGQLYLATGVYMDRSGRSYPNGLSPEVEADPAQPSTGQASPAQKAAMAWLRRQPGCR